MPTYEALLADAAGLPVADRIQLMDALWDTLPAECLPLSDEWAVEIRRRSAEYDRGSVATAAWDLVKAAALQRLEATPPDAAP